MLKNLVNIAILTTIVIVVWVFVSVYQSFTSSTISMDVEKQIEPISPTFNMNAVSNVQTRKFIPTDLSETIVLPTGTQNESGSGSESALLQPNLPQSIAQSQDSGIATGSGVSLFNQ